MGATTPTETMQDRMKARLAQVGIPAREIKVYGSQIVITCLSSSAAEKWAVVLRKFATVRAIAKESLDETAESRPNEKRYVRVWRTWATI